MDREDISCLIFLVVILSRFGGVFSYPQGAPTDACTKALYPKHNVPFNRASHSYVINVFKDGTRDKVDHYTPGEPVLVSISGGNLKGVLIMPIKNGKTGDFADGTWDFQDTKSFHSVTCGNGKARGMTHSHSNVKKDGEVIGRWTPSLSLRGSIKFQSTIVVTKENFFIGIFTDFLSQKEPPPNVPETTTPTSEISQLSTLRPQVSTSNEDVLLLTSRVQTLKTTIKVLTSPQSGEGNTQLTRSSFVTSRQANEITVTEKGNAQGFGEDTQSTMSSTRKSEMLSNKSSIVTVSFPVAISLSLLGLVGTVIK